MSFTVLVVCTANQCRSPLAEFAIRRQAHQAGLDWSLVSAGTAAVAGLPPDPKVAEIIAGSGADLSSWRSRRVDAELLRDADLVLVMERDHRSAIALTEPAALPRTRLLLDFAAQVADLTRNGIAPEEMGPALVEAGTQMSLQPTTSGREVADPVGRARRAYRRCARELDEAARAIVLGPDR